MADQKTVSPNQYRTHVGGELSKKYIGENVRLSGWVHTRRDHGNLIFIDLRDKWGITQLTFDPSKNKEAWAIAEKLKDEYVIGVQGKVAARPEDMVNSKLSTGEIEIEVDTINILGKAKALPFAISSNQEVNEELRLQYRFLDLRTPRLQKLLVTRDQFISHIRSYMHSRNFIEVQTPILANSSPEGARDFLVPSRIHPGQFYALPQAPQQFKQLLMAAGVERYFQIAPCFRDEDPRADRHPGVFYQLDMEMSFVTQEDVFNIIEPLMVELTEKFSNKKLITQPFPRLPWRETISKYGIDKPDLRYDLTMTDVSGIVRDSKFKIFEEALKNGGVVHALPVPKGASFTRSTIDSLTEVATKHGATGLSYILFKSQASSPIVKFLDEDTIKSLKKKTGVKKGDAIFFTAGPWPAACQALGAVRTAVAKKQKLIDDAKAAWCWVVDFPMYEKNEATGQIDFSHNPFSMPQEGLKGLHASDPTTILGYQYDLAFNGFEISSGAIRNHDPEIMYQAFSIAGYSKKEVDDKFGGMIRAFQYGTPPHGGFAPGIDRLLMALLDLPSIRDVYAFPKNGRGQDLLMNSPAPVSPEQLKDLHLKLDLDD